MTRPVSWILSKKGLAVCCELTDAEYQALPQATLVGLLSSGVVATRTVKVTQEEFVAIGGFGAVRKRPNIYEHVDLEKAGGK